MLKKTIVIFLCNLRVIELDFKIIEQRISDCLNFWKDVAAKNNWANKDNISVQIWFNYDGTVNDSVSFLTLTNNHYILLNEHGSIVSSSPKIEDVKKWFADVESEEVKEFSQSGMEVFDEIVEILKQKGFQQQSTDYLNGTTGTRFFKAGAGLITLSLNEAPDEEELEEFEDDENEYE